MRRRAPRLCAVLVAGLAGSSAHGAIVYHVNDAGDASDADPNDGVCQTQVPGVCTLRAAVAQANVTGGQIDIPAMAITTMATITIRNDISGNGGHQVFIVAGDASAAVKVSIADLTLRDGHESASWGGAIATDHADLTIERCLFTNNDAPRGGAITGSPHTFLRIHDSVFTLINALFAGAAVNCAGA